ncbi:MAG TPA: TolC family protein [Thermodesulfobacteriota bacterium]|jgi:outer membrane protein|nr:TolC family protein [Thermodesulfobacteriota bacterium]
MRVKYFIGLILWAIVSMSAVWAQESRAPLTLEESIKIAMERSLTVHSAVVGIVGSEFRRKEAITNFLPLWTGQYGWTLYNTPVTIGRVQANVPGIAVPASKDIYNFGTTVNQPIFTGGLNLATYRSAKLGVDLSKESLEAAKLDLVLQVRVGYFTILRAEKFLAVAEQQVKNFEAQLAVTQAFFDVGIVPKNDVLLAEVNLANAKQQQVKAANDLATAKASFNILLRREVNTPFEVVDILAYKAFPLSFEQSLDEALWLRPEVKAAQLNIDQAKENVKIARSGFFPMVNLAGNYNRLSDDPYVGGGFKFDDNWTVQASATFTLWNWGNTAFKVGENKVKVTQAEDSKKQLVDSITLEVRDDYLNLLTAEKNISTAEKAIEQADENLRMNEERYKYQVATQTDVVNAVTLLAQARTNYYGALSDFNVAKAQLERAMGRKTYP